MDPEKIAELAAAAPLLDELAAYPLPDGQTLITAGTGGGIPIAFRVPREVGDRFAAGMLTAAGILGRAVEPHDPDAPPRW
jgi:hypothetical protein